ncbi:hypothetical protein [Streptomyces sp. NPDC058614]|uniref:hypothetical protein n=1 Tax=Streptomyces sp. NPDC058614 TaxID=3346557 RepID=UPI003649FDD8
MGGEDGDARGREPSGVERVAASQAGAPEVEPAGEGGWWDAEILKVLMGADVEMDSEILPVACVEAEEGHGDGSVI